MPRWRKLYVKTVESQDVNEMPDDFTRLVWLLLPLAVDREGRGLDNTAWIKAKIMPLRLDVDLEQMSRAVDWLVEREMVKRYQVNGRSYFWLPTFGNYQGDTSKEAASTYPPPPELLQSRSGATPELVQSKSASDSDSDADADTDSDANSDSDSERTQSGAREHLSTDLSTEYTHSTEPNARPPPDPDALPDSDSDTQNSDAELKLKAIAAREAVEGPLPALERAQMRSWFKQYGPQRVYDATQIVRHRKPKNPGAYMRAVLGRDPPTKGD